MPPENRFPVPEQGQLVEVRNRQFVVTDVLRSSLPGPGLAALEEAQHLVSLSAIEDDALGEEIQVVWELESLARVFDQGILPEPTGFDEPHRFDAFLNAVRWGAVSSADVRALQAPFRSGIDIEDYQLDPVVRAIQMPRVNLLIADDVGLGKTIEAGLVAQELIIRHRARRILIVCPAALQVQWRDQMRDKFGLTFRIVDSDLMRQLRRRRGIHVNPWSHFPRLITSIDFLKRDRPIRLFREVLPAEGEMAYPRRFDLLIVDEAHNVAPSGRGHYAVDSDRTRAIRLLTPHFEHRLFLTATPHNGYVESFSALLELLDSQRFARGIPPNRAALDSIMVRRLKTEILDWSGQPRFQPRRLEAIEVAHTDAERQAHRSLQRYTELRHRREMDPVERTATEFVLKLLKKRLFSSPQAFAGTLAQHRASLSGRRPAQESASSLRRPTVGVLRGMVERVEEEYADDDAFADATQEAIQTSAAALSSLSTEEQSLLDELSRWAQSASARPDSKAEALIDWLHRTIRPGGVWSDERVIIFTEYRDTQKWLQGLLAAQGLTAGDRLLLLYGGMPTDRREEIKAAFLADPALSPVRILLATDAASEGIDLQRHCHRLIHYEIPWNPNRLEQRNGRIDRHGQPYQPLIYHFAPQGYSDKPQNEDVAIGDLEGDLEFLRRVVEKVETIREDLGKVGPVLAQQVTEAMLGQRRRLQTEEAERSAQPARRLLTFERDLNARIQRLHDQLQETRQSLDLSPENVQAVVEIGLALAGQPPLRPTTLEGVWPDPAGLRAHCPVFHLPPLGGSWSQCSEGLAHPHTQEMRPIVFDHALSRGRDDVVLAHLNHRLVQMSLRLLRAEVWSQSPNGLHRVTARTVLDHLLAEPAVIAHARLVIVGGDSHRLHEELIESGGLVRQGRFRRLPVTQVRELLAGAGDSLPPERVRQQLMEVWPQIRASVQQTLDVRMGERSTSLQRQLTERQEKEMVDMQAILAELAQTIQAELSTPEMMQLEFSFAEKEQYSRNRSALAARLAEIPGEMEAEREVIRKRFADP
jgi:superfamily II DNA or RNA helicase